MSTPTIERLFGQLAEDFAAAPLIAELFVVDPDRFQSFSAGLDDLLIDFSKTSLTSGSLATLLDVMAKAGVETLRDAMFAGQRINVTEDRAVLHTALRSPAGSDVTTAGKNGSENVMADVTAELGRLGDFAEGIRAGRIAAAGGERFTDVVNIGIGGSDLGPAMATIALEPYRDGPRLHFVSNVDGAHLTDVLKRLDPATTLFIVASKTFTTIETMTNAASARRWIVAGLGEDAVGAHFVAVSTALDKAGAFGIGGDRVFGFWDWVGGRYSIWSAIGLPLMLAVGREAFAAFLAGGHAMDEHFRTAPLARNLPVLLAAVGLWHRDVASYPTRALIPYDQRLARFPAYVQQLDMESNGKSVTRDGKRVARPTGPVVWGEPGTNSQHAFFQLLHQGTDVIPVEFIVGAEGHEPELGLHQQMLIANCLAQSEALLRGRTLDEARNQLLAAGRSAEDAEMIAPHRVFPGNRPSVTIAYRTLDPNTLGRLIALYEHRVFVEAAVWNINAFDQWGVELGKELATALLPFVQGGPAADGTTGSTLGLMDHLRDLGA